MKRQRFAILNLMLLMMIGAAPLMRADRPLTRLAFTMLFAAILTSAVYAVGRRWHARGLVASLAVLAMLARFVEQFHSDRVTLVVSTALGILVLSSVILLILRHLFSVRTADYETINAALCVYLLMGVLWAFVYSLTEAGSPGSFHLPLAAEGSRAMRLGGAHSVTALYYSFVTMTTLGYGDVVPIGGIARTLAILQAVLGQTYLVVIVARLVGLQVAAVPDKTT